MFIDKSDYDPIFKEYRLDQITENTDALLDSCEARAIDYIKSYLHPRYDVDAIFSATGNNRNQYIVQITLECSMFFISSRVNPRKVPDWIQKRWDEVAEWLKDVQQGMINPPALPLNPTTDSGSKLIDWGSNPRRNNHII